MLSFRSTRQQLLLLYAPEQNPENWIIDEFLEYEDTSVKVRTAFHFTLKDVINASPRLTLIKTTEMSEDIDLENEFVEFELGRKKGSYFEIPARVLMTKNPVFLHNTIALDEQFFIAETKISIIYQIDQLVSEAIYIGGSHPTAIPANAYQELLDSFPTTYEKKRYAEARIAAIIRSYFPTATDGEGRYETYMNKKVSASGTNLLSRFRKSEYEKYQAILEKMQFMLDNEGSYNEKKWQNEILQIILLLYPKYLYVFEEVKIPGDAIAGKKIDYMLVDANGHVDIIEIKRPFSKSILTQTVYRNNHIPEKELSGTIMQVEKYIFFLNRWGAIGEKTLTKRYQNKLQEDFTIKITNPGGIIIMGREDRLTVEQKIDLEVVKRKYKNVMDIITYDNLIYRLKTILTKFEIPVSE